MSSKTIQTPIFHPRMVFTFIYNNNFLVLVIFSSSLITYHKCVFHESFPACKLFSRPHTFMNVVSLIYRQMSKIICYTSNLLFKFNHKNILVSDVNLWDAYMQKYCVSISDNKSIWWWYFCFSLEDITGIYFHCV